MNMGNWQIEMKINWSYWYKSMKKEKFPHNVYNGITLEKGRKVITRQGDS